jgi:hypothetical protein
MTGGPYSTELREHHGTLVHPPSEAELTQESGVHAVR